MQQKPRKISWWQRNYLVNRDFQNKFAISAAFIGVFSSLVSVGLLLWAFWAFNIWQGQRLPNPVLFVLALILIINVSSIYVAAILATHRIVGPIFNLLRQFQRVSNGDFGALARFREDDEMHYLARRFNEMVVKLGVRNDLIAEKVTLLKVHLQNGETENATVVANSLSLIFENEAKAEHA